MKWLWMLLFIVVMMPVVVNRNIYLIMNNDTSGHLLVFNAIKDGSNPQFLYFGQEVVGYSIVWLNNVTHIGIGTLFIWFNFICLYLSGVFVALMVRIVTGNSVAAFLSACMIIFGVLSTLRLFISGTIFNIIDILIILPAFLIFIHQIIEKRKAWLIIPMLSLGIMLLVFHPSFGIGSGYAKIMPLFSVTNPIVSSGFQTNSTLSPYLILFSLFGAGTFALLMVCLALIYKMKPIIRLSVRVILILSATLSLGLLLGGYIGITGFSTRLLINSTLIAGIMLSIILGLVYNKNRYGKVVIFFVMVCIAQNLINWMAFIR